MSSVALQNPFTHLSVQIPTQPVPVPSGGKPRKARKSPEEILQRQREAQRNYRQQNKHRKYMQDYGLTEEEAKLYISLQVQLKTLREAGRIRIKSNTEVPQTPSIYDLQNSIHDMSIISQDGSSEEDQDDYEEDALE